MSSSTEAPFSYTSKVDGNLFTVRGQDFANFTENMGLAYGDAASDILQRASEQAIPLSAGYSESVQQGAVTYLQQGGLVPPPNVPVNIPAGVPVAQQYGAPQPQQGAAPSCHHGVKVYREGTGKNGRPWKAWMCPSPSGTPDQCPAQWLR